MREWTDVDYAQAAIDMLPGSVEEIDLFLSTQDLGPTRQRDGNRCPVARWVSKWVGHTVYAGTYSVYMGESVGEGEGVGYPESVWRYVARYDTNTLGV